MQLRTLKSWYEKYLLDGEIKPPQWRGSSESKIHPDAQELILEEFERDPEIYLHEIQRTLRDHGHDAPGKSSTWRFMRKKGYTLQRLCRIARQAIEAETYEWFTTISDLEIRAEMMLVIDESHVSDESYRRRRGWAKKGSKYRYKKKFFIQKTVSVIAAFNTKGFLECSMRVEDENVDGDTFLDYFRYQICPYLGRWAELEENSVVACMIELARNVRRTRLLRSVLHAGRASHVHACAHVRALHFCSWSLQLCVLWRAALHARLSPCMNQMRPAPGHARARCR